MRFEILQLLYSIIRLAAPLLRKIANHDPDLAKQIRRALNSAVLQAAEGNRARGRNRNAKFRGAYGEANEARAGFGAAAAWGDITEKEAQMVDQALDKACGSLWKLSR